MRVPRDFYSVYVVTRTISQQLYAPSSSISRDVYRQLEGQCTRRSVIPRLTAYHFVGHELRPAYTSRDFPFSLPSWATRSGSWCSPRVWHGLASLPISAWIAANDRTAIVCMDYLRARGIRVPRDLSLVSFDHTMEASFLNLASYTFNSAGMADAILGFLLRRRPRPGEAVSLETVETLGRIVMRHSLAENRPRG